MKKEQNSNKLKSIGFWIIFILFFWIQYLLAYILDNKWYSYVFITLALVGLLYLRNKKHVKAWRYSGVWLAAIIICVVSVMFGRQDLEISFTGNVINKTAEFIIHKVLPERTMYEEFKNAEDEPYDFNSWTAPKGYNNENIPLSKSKGYLLTKDDGNHEKVVYQLHGGAYIYSYTKGYNDNSILFSKAYNNSDVFSLDYRVAGESPYPAALDDAVEGYKWLLTKGYKSENIVVAGDSAGGGLSLALTLKLRDMGEKLPKCLVLGSPWTDVSQKGESYTYNRKEDAVFGSDNDDDIGKLAIPTIYADDDSVYNPYISPVYADFTGMPPMLIQAGSTEMLLSDSTTVYEKAKSEGVDIELKIYKGMFHTFYNNTEFIPEAKEAWDTIENFIN